MSNLSALFGNLFITDKKEPCVKTSPMPRRVLLIGEGDFSYALAYTKLHPDYDIVATEYYSYGELKAKYDNFEANYAQLLQRKNVTVLFGVNAEELAEDERIQGVFDKAVFNFPYTGVRGRSTADLVHNFFLSLRDVLVTNGRVSMGVVDNYHYDGQYVLWKATTHNRFKLAKPRKKFDASGYYKEHGYTHVSTNKNRIPKKARCLKYSFTMVADYDPTFDSEDEFFHSSEHSSDEGRKTHLSSVKRSLGKNKTKMKNAIRNRIIIIHKYGSSRQAFYRAMDLFHNQEYRKARRTFKRIAKINPNNQYYQTILDNINVLISINNE